MTIGTAIIQIHLHGLESLKQKRSIVKSVVNRLRNKFNVSVSEVAAHDSKRLAVVGLAVVSNESGHCDKQIDTILNFVHADGRFYVGHVEREIFSSEDYLDYS